MPFYLIHSGIFRLKAKPGENWSTLYLTEGQPTFQISNNQFSFKQLSFLKQKQLS